MFTDKELRLLAERAIAASDRETNAAIKALFASMADDAAGILRERGDERSKENG